MKKLLIAVLMAMPLWASAQDNTWEKTEEASVETTDRDAKYLEKDAVPMVEGRVCWEAHLKAPGKSAAQIYDILLAQLEKMTKEANQIKDANSTVAVKDTDKRQLGAVFHEWLVFKNAFLSLDRTQMNFMLVVDCKDGEAHVKMTHITYDYDLERDPIHYAAESWITDKYCVNKKHTKLLPASGKFRRKTIDRKDFIFNKFSTLLKD